MNTLKSVSQLIAGALGMVALLSATAVAQDAPKLTDPEIASVAVTANQIDVNYGKIALKRSKNAEVRKFAQNMIDDHTSVIQQAVALAKKLGVRPKDNAVTQSLLKGEKETTKMLKSKKGNAFNKAYIDNEVKYHEAVINAVKNVLIPQAQNQQLKDLLIKVSPVLNQHLEHAKRVQAGLK